MKAIGEQAPSFRLYGPDGSARALADLNTSGPVLLVFVAEECPTSRLTLARLEALSEPLARAGTTIVAIHQDPPETTARTMRRAHATYAALCEPAPYETAAAFGVATLPTSFLIDSGGTIEEAFEGWSREDFDRVAARAAAHAGVAPGRVTAEHPQMKPGCASKNTLAPELLASAEPATGRFDLLEDMFERGWTDGLPVIPPTRERVDRMLAGRDPHYSLGPVPPGMGVLTLERLAVCAVLAGCRPSYFPAGHAAAEAILEPDFNVHGMTNTTHTCGIVVIVNGPARQRIGMNAGINCMGGWNRANATIGRAVRLVVGLTGQGLPGTLDRSTLGQPGKISFCFAENEEESPWEPLSATRGFAADSSVATVYCGDAPFSVSDHYSRDPENVIASIAMAGAAAFSPNLFPMAAETVFVISPEHARTFADAGWSKGEVAQRILDASKRSVKDLDRGERSPLLAALEPDAVVSKWLSPSEIVLVVAGGHAGRFSAVLPPWIGYGLGSKIISREIREDA
jgi:peroxiredoxin